MSAPPPSRSWDTDAQRGRVNAKSPSTPDLTARADSNDASRTDSAGLERLLWKFRRHTPRAGRTDTAQYVYPL